MARYKRRSNLIGIRTLVCICSVAATLAGAAGAIASVAFMQGKISQKVDATAVSVEGVGADLKDINNKLQSIGQDVAGLKAAVELHLKQVH